MTTLKRYPNNLVVMSGFFGGGLKILEVDLPAFQISSTWAMLSRLQWTRSQESYQETGEEPTLFKKGDKHSPSNYHPISLTSLVVKCLERLVYTRNLEFLEANNLVVISMDFVKGTRARLSYWVRSMSGLDPWISDSLHMSSTLIFPERSTLYHTRG